MNDDYHDQCYNINYFKIKGNKAIFYKVKVSYCYEYNVYDYKINNMNSVDNQEGNIKMEGHINDNMID